jgi:hypothetical protein
VNARYARDPGFSFYTYLSDQQGVPYSIKVMSATEAPYLLDGLLHHSTQNIGTHYTDTGGASDTYSSSARCSASVSAPGCAISPVSEIIKGSPTSCCSLRLRKCVVVGLLNVVRGWGIYCITTTETLRELASRCRAMDEVWLGRPVPLPR